MRLQVKVVPGASRAEVVGWLGDSLKVRVTDPPERGKANAAVLDLLSRNMEMDPERLSLIAGGGSARKVVEIKDFDPDELRVRLKQDERE